MLHKTKVEEKWRESTTKQRVASAKEINSSAKLKREKWNRSEELRILTEGTEGRRKEETVQKRNEVKGKEVIGNEGEKKYESAIKKENENDKEIFHKRGERARESKKEGVLNEE